MTDTAATAASTQQQATAAATGGDAGGNAANVNAAQAEAAKQYTGVHSFMVNACKFVVDTKYAPLKPLGRGAYGVVCSAMDKVSNRKVAIKKIPKYSATTTTLTNTTATAATTRQPPSSTSTQPLSCISSLRCYAVLCLPARAFDDLIDAKRILREVKLLRHFRHENIIALRDLVGPTDDEPFEDMSAMHSTASLLPFSVSP